jgi:hypothetical protein
MAAELAWPEGTALSKNRTNMATKTLDLGCGDTPKNPFNMDVVYGVDIRKVPEKNILKADLAVERIPFDSDMFDAVSAFDFIEHVPRIIYNPKRRHSGSIKLLRLKPIDKGHI